MYILEHFQNSTNCNDTPLVDRSIALNLPVFFCCEDNKKPTCPNGFYDAVSNPDEIRALHKRYGGGLIAAPTGPVTGWAVLDIDSAKHPETTTDWLDEYAPRLPYTRRDATRSGGQHFFFNYREGLRCSTGRIALGIDVRALGGYVILWRAHGFCSNNAPLADWPDWLFELAAPKPKPIIQRSFARQSQAAIDDAIDGLLAAVAIAAEGTRACILFWAACRMGERVAAEQLAEDYAVELLAEAASEAGLPEDEAIGHIQRGLITGGTE